MRPRRIARSTILCCSVAVSFTVASPAAPHMASAHAANLASSRAHIPASVVVIKRLGAAVHAAASVDAATRVVATCGSSARVLGYTNGWYRVSYDSSQAIRHGGAVTGWIGGRRVADTSNPPSYDCTDSYVFQVGQHGYSYVRSGCLSLRAYPSRTAPYTHCVANFHDYTVTNGPIEVGAEDWFGVTSRATGAGWVSSQYLLLYRDKGGFVIYPNS